MNEVTATRGREHYVGGKSTLCTGCGHDSVTQHLITACFQAGIDPQQVAKLSGIGCSSKTTAYFMNEAHGFNTIHGRMAPVATGVHLANSNLKIIGISGDGDTASIGLSGFAHLIRRNVPMLYVVENNGVYGLTKGQFSATADAGSLQKSGAVNPFAGIDLCSLAIDLGCTFVARSFSGDAKQLVPLFSAALRHQGTAFIDVVSPCIAFANHEGSTRSYDAVRGHYQNLQQLEFIQPQAEIKVDYPEGSVEMVKLPDGSTLMLHKLKHDWFKLDDSSAAIKALQEARHKGEILTGLFHWQRDKKSLANTLKLGTKPLRDLEADDLRPSRATFEQILASYQ